MKITELTDKIKNGGFDASFARLYGKDAIEIQRIRYAKAAESFCELFGSDRDVHVFSVPGRSEISGNHTDHNRGCVLAAAVDLDIIAIASKRDDGIATVKSEGFDADTVSVTDGKNDCKKYSSAALIKGMGAGFLKEGYDVGGFDAFTTSNVKKGSGLSSSAAFEVMIGTILNYLYNEGKADEPEVARIAQYAENEFFGKPCGLMDQTACAVGGFIAIDFIDPAAAKIEKLPFDLTAAGYSLCITDTGGNHADLNEDYASVPSDMKLVASKFGRDVLRGLSIEEIAEKVPELRETVGDRAILRAFHFITENDRVAFQSDALKRGDLDAFLDGVKESGRSSFMWLQNCFTVKNIYEQGVSLALFMSEYLLRDKKAAYRVHGGGFAGTVQAFVPHEAVGMYTEGMEKVFGKGSCTPLSIRAEGAVMLG